MDWIYQANDPLWPTVAGSVLIFLVVVILTRIVGLRSFAKFTAYDFAFTIAVGSIISSILTSSTTVVHGSVAIVTLLLLTFVFSSLQRRFQWVNQLISNKPLLLMKGPEILDKNLAHARVERSQLIAKLREANVIHFDQVLAVVLESTGDISVLHVGDDDDCSLGENILEGVREHP